MSPLEVGILISTLLVFGLALFFPRLTVSFFWGTAGLLFLTAGLLTWLPGNLWLINYQLPVTDLTVVLTTQINWFTAGWLLGHWYTTVHLTAVTGQAVQSSYEAGLFAGGLSFVDYRTGLSFLVVVTTWVYFRLQSHYEVLVVLLISVVASYLSFQVDHLLLLYLTLELQALCLYTLIGYDRFNQDRVEASLKYLLLGSLVSGLLLISISQFYGSNGSFLLLETVQTNYLSSSYLTGVMLFKLGVWPFYFWSPVVYLSLDWGTLITVIAVAKVNLWYLLVAQLSLLSNYWLVWYAGLFSVVIGSIGGYYQTLVGSLLAYSSVVNGGYALLLMSSTNLWHYHYYLLLYLTTTAGLLLLLSSYSSTQSLHYRLLSKFSLGYPLLIYYFTLSLSGLPVYPGIFAKLVLTEGLLTYGWLLLVLVIVLSVVPAVYYLQLSSRSLFETSDYYELTQPSFLLPVSLAFLTLLGNGFFNFVCFFLIRLS